VELLLLLEPPLTALLLLMSVVAAEMMSEFVSVGEEDASMGTVEKAVLFGEEQVKLERQFVDNKQPLTHCKCIEICCCWDVSEVISRS